MECSIDNYKDWFDKTYEKDLYPSIIRDLVSAERSNKQLWQAMNFVVCELGLPLRGIVSYEWTDYGLGGCIMCAVVGTCETKQGRKAWKFL